MKNPVFIVCLRKPRGKDDRREDPYWEVGSFGCTGCHEKNLLHPGKEHVPEGARLAFAQGGPNGTRLVLLTPPVKVHKKSVRLEIRWKSTVWPFRYEDAPLLVDVQGNSDFPKLKAYIKRGKSSKWTCKLGSKFRSKASSLPDEIAIELERKFNKEYKNAPRRQKFLTYLDALPLSEEQKEYFLLNHPCTRGKRIQEYKRQYGRRKCGCCGKAKAKRRCC